MKSVAQEIEALRRHGSVALDFWRAQLLRARGAHLGWRVRVGPGARVERPWMVTIGDRCEIEPDVWIKVVDDAARVEIGAYTFLGRGVELDVSNSVTIGARVLIAPGVFITDHGHVIDGRTPIAEQGCASAVVAVGDDAWLGVGSVILPGVSIGKGAVVGAGAVVTGNVPDWAIVAGVPARVLRYREP